jgi:FAD/FMN-containing dehydrogenase
MRRLPESLAQRNEFWKLREMLPETQKSRAPRSSTTFRCRCMRCRPSSPRAIAVASVWSQRRRVVCFGHMGDGNIHYNISQPLSAWTETRSSRSGRHEQGGARCRARMNGSISAEHGIGQLKRDELIATAPPIAIDLMRRVKAAFDPAGIMNPGKLSDFDILSLVGFR